MTNGWASIGNGRRTVAASTLLLFARSVCSHRSEQPPQNPPYVAVAPRIFACRCFLFAVAHKSRARFSTR
jgi:hypothetical protein